MLCRLSPDIRIAVPALVTISRTTPLTVTIVIYTPLLASLPSEGVQEMKKWSRRSNLHQPSPTEPKAPTWVAGRCWPKVHQALAPFNGTTLKSGFVSPVSGPCRQDQPCPFCRAP